MAFTKADLIKAVMNENGYDQRQATETIETLFEIMKRTLASGDDVLISGFGKFCVKQEVERRGRNPATGGGMMLAQRKVVTFKCSGILKDLVSGG